MSQEARRTVFGLLVSLSMFISGHAAEPMDSTGAHARPILSIIGDQITFDGKRLRLGGELASWKKVLKGKPVCTDAPNTPGHCRWDDLGIDIGTDQGYAAVTFFNVHLQDAVVPDYLVGMTLDEIQNPGPRFGFRGVLTVDSVHIHQNTKLIDVLAKLDPARGVRCGLRDCAVARGSFDNDTVIHFELNGRRVSDTIGIIAFSRLRSNNAEAKAR